VPGPGGAAAYCPAPKQQAAGRGRSGDEGATRPERSRRLLTVQSSAFKIWDDGLVHGQEPLAPLRRGDLDTISFVRDYVEVRIDYNVLRCFTGPIVRTRSGDFRFPGRGSRDALCGLIGSVISRTHVGDEAIELHTESGQTLVLPLDERSRTMPDGHLLPEAVHLVPADERGRLVVAKMFIW